MAVDPNIKKKADDIRNKIYGREVRESLASGLEAMSSDVVGTVGRQDEVESQWQNVVDETTGKDVISAPEIIAARDGEANLKARLDKEHNEVTTQLAQANQKVNDLGINLRDFGVEDGDDITDVLISLLDNSYKIYIPEGTYFWSKPIKTDKVVKIEGSGKDTSTLVYKPNTSNDLAQNAFDIAVPHDVITDKNNIAEIEELTFKDESENSLSLMKVALIRSNNNNERWGARVHFHKTDFYDYKNTGLTVISPYEATFSHMKFESFESFDEGYKKTPVNTTTGLKLTGVGRNLSTMGNVILIKGCSFQKHKYAVDMINCRGVNFEDTVFEHNWISVYLHSKNEAKWSTRNIQFDNCWFEDTGNGHPDYYVVDCFIDETTGEVDTTKERANNIRTYNTTFYDSLGKTGGFPGTNTHNMTGKNYSSDNASKSYLLRQWDSAEERNNFSNHDAVITQIGGDHNYFRGKVTGGNGFQKNLSSSKRHDVDVNYIYENIEQLDFNATSDTHVLLVDLREFNTPELSSENHLISLFLNSQITLILQSNEGVEPLLEMEYSGRPITSNDNPALHDFKTKYLDTTHFNLRRVDIENEDNNNNRGVRLSRDGYHLKFEFDVNGLKGGRIFFENKYIVYESTREM